MRTRTLQRARTPIAAALLGLLAAGCGGSDAPARPPVTPVKGVLTRGGAPVGRATITFRPKRDNARPAVAITNSKGEFSGTTYTTGDGLRPGEYDVFVSKMETVAVESLSEDDPNYGLWDDVPASEIPPKNVLPEEYSVESDGPPLLQLTVGEQPMTDYKIEL